VDYADNTDEPTFPCEANDLNNKNDEGITKSYASLNCNPNFSATDLHRSNTDLAEDPWHVIRPVPHAKSERRTLRVFSVSRIEAGSRPRKLSGPICVDLRSSVAKTIFELIMQRQCEAATAKRGD
jgi:hypothetical protein